MKTVVIILSSFAIAAGIVVGWHEHEGSRAAASAGAGAVLSPTPSAGFLAPPPPPPPVEKRKKRWKPRDSSIVLVEPSQDPTGAASGSSTEVRALPPPETAMPAPGASPRLDAIAASLRRRDFAGAEKAARALLEDPAALSPGEKQSAQRLVAKARVLARLPLPVPEGARTTTLQEVFLANGLRLEAASVAETADRYEVTLVSGVVYSAPREDVLQVKPLEGKVAVPIAKDGAAWKDLEPKIARLTHPIEIFTQGVQRLFRMGFDKEAFDLLDRLLERQDSDAIALLFLPEGGEEALAEWKLAGGRGGSLPDASATPASSESEPGLPPDPGALARVKELVEEARALYQGSVAKDGSADKLMSAREKLDQALEILDPLPAGNEAIKILRREVAQLLSDVSRQLPF